MSRRPRELLVATVVVAMLASAGSLGVGVLTSATASATPPTLREITNVACNNTFNGTKFPLQYIVDSTPSANPVAPGDSFTVSFHVTAIVAASFLNGVYAAVGVNTLPINPDQVTIAPLTNATGPDVVTGLASTFTIPKPTVVPVTAGVNIDLGTVTGTYTAGAAPGPATFAIKGDAWAPPRTIADGFVTNGSTTVTSGTASFTISDVGATVTGTGIPVGDTIASVVDAATVVLASAASTTPRTVSSGHTTNHSTAITAPAGSFSAADIGQTISSSTGFIPAGATIAAVASGTAATLSVAATATGNANVFSIGTATNANISLTISGDPLPVGQTEPAWIGAAKTLTNSGKQSYETTSLAGGLIKASVVCMGGNWTPIPLGPATPRTVTDGQATTGSATITSATAAFTSADVGGTISGTGIPANETILSVTSATTAVMTTEATATTTTGSWTITASGSPRTVTDGVARLRSVTDGASTTGSATITSATASFAQSDVGAAITGTGIPANDTIASVTSATTAVLKTVASGNTAAGAWAITPIAITSATAAFSSADVGASITGTGIPAFDTIASVVNSTTAVLKLAPVTAAAPGTWVITPTTNYGPPLLPATGFSAVSIQVSSVAPAVTGNPSSQTVTAGQPYSFSASASGNPTPTVQWQVSTNGGGSFSDIPGATSTTLSGTAAAGDDGHQFRAVFTNTAGSATTTAATLTVQVAPQITANPTGQAVSAGQPYSFSASASGNPTPTVQWQVSTNGGGSFSNIPGATSTTLSGTAVSGDDGHQFRAVFTNVVGSATTTAATLSVPVTQVGPAVTSNPSSQTVNAGDAYSFSASATGVPAPTVQWQVSTNGGGSFSNVVGATSTTLSGTAAAGDDGHQFRAVFTNVVSSATTTAATLTVHVGPVVTSSPSSQTVNAGDSYSFSASASGNPAPTVQWQVSTDGGGSFSDIPGATSTTLSGTAAAGDDGHEFRAVFTNVVSSATTTAATLSVHVGPAVTANPSNQSVTAGQPFSFSASASGNPAPSVQWQVSTDGGGSFSNIPGATSTTLSGTAALGDDGHQFRAVFTNVVSSATTTAATLSVTAAPVAPAITGDPSSQTVNAGDSFSFSASASGVPAPTVQWQVSTDGGGSYADIPGATSTTYSGPSASDADGDMFRAVFTNTVGSATSAAATLTVHVGPAVTSNPSDQSVIAGQSYSFSASASGNPAPSVQWQLSTDGGGSFSNIPGATSTTLSGTAALADDGHQFRAVFTNVVSSATTTAATLSVAAAPVAPAITGDPSSQTVNAGDAYSFSASATGFPAPSVQWQVSTDGGGSFSDISGATSTTLSGTAAAGDDGHQFRAVFTNTVGSATSAAATLTVHVGPAVTANPSDQTVTDGLSFSFSASASGNPAPTVQWQVSTDGGGSFSDIPGATSTTFSGPASAADDGHQFRAVFTNTVGSVTTTVATLHVTSVSVALTSSVNPTLFGQGTFLTAQVSSTTDPLAALTGTMSFYDGSTLIGTKAVAKGKATLLFTKLGAGSHDLTAVYDRGAPFATVQSAVLTQTVGQTATTVTISSSAQASVFGQPVKLKASVQPVAPAAGKVTGGTVDFFDGTDLLGTVDVVSGNASLPSNKVLIVGGHDITAVYSGSPDAQGSSTAAAFVQTVSQASTSITIVGDPFRVTGQAAPIKAQVKPVAPSTGSISVGSVDFYDGGVFVGSSAVTSGSAALPVDKTRSVGDHTFTAVYHGTTSWADAVAVPFVQTVSPASTMTTLISSAPDTTFGHAGTITALVRTLAPGTGVPTGTVTFYDGGVPIATVAVGSTGKAAIPLASLAVGTHTITATYDGSPRSNQSAADSILQIIR